MSARPIVPLERARIFYDGGRTTIRLRHPECVAIDDDGNVWCGGESGEIYRIDRDGSTLELVASCGGATLGIAFDGRGYLYACDALEATVDRLDLSTGSLEPFTRERAGRMQIPNFPVIDIRRRCLYVSDSYSFAEAGPGIWRFDLDSGEGELWYASPLRFANGMALAPDGDMLYVAETFARRVVAVAVEDDGSPSGPTIIAEAIDRLPDGLAIDVEGTLYISCYEPSRLYRLRRGRIELLLDDPDAHMLCHPTNCAFRGSELFIANLGRCHITQVTLDVPGLPLPLQSGAE